MSATGRNKAGHERRDLDFYETPAWATRAIMRALPIGGSILDAGAGTGAILREVLRTPEARSKIVLARGIELDTSRAAAGNAFLEGEGRSALIRKGDFFEHAKSLEGLGAANAYDVVIGNPPYNLAEEFIDAARTIAPVVIFLLRLNFLGSQKRAAKFSIYMPDVYVLPKRPSFTGDGRTDATEYAWFVWGRERMGGYRITPSIGRIQILDVISPVLE